MHIHMYIYACICTHSFWCCGYKQSKVPFERVT